MSEIFLFTILLLLTFFQSIFGIGLLLLGTPTLFLLGFNYYETINILLPISILVSFIQVIKSKEKIKNFKIDFNFFCLPGLILGSILILNYIQNFNFKFAISILLILSSIISIKKKNLWFLEM